MIFWYQAIKLINSILPRPSNVGATSLRHADFGPSGYLISSVRPTSGGIPYMPPKEVPDRGLET